MPKLRRIRLENYGWVCAKYGAEFTLNDLIQLDDNGTLLILEVCGEDEKTVNLKAVNYSSTSLNSDIEKNDIREKEICLDKSKLYGWCKTKRADQFNSEDVIQEEYGLTVDVVRVMSETETTVTLEIRHAVQEAEYYNEATHNRTYLKDKLLGIGHPLPSC